MLSTNSFEQESASWVSVGSAAQLAPGRGRCFLIGARKIALFRLRNGKLFALDAVCPHRDGPLAEGVVGCETVICPLHGYKFSLVDGRGLDSDLSVNTYTTEIRNGNVYVRLPV